MQQTRHDVTIMLLHHFLMTLPDPVHRYCWEVCAWAAAAKEVKLFKMFLWCICYSQKQKWLNHQISPRLASPYRNRPVPNVVHCQQQGGPEWGTCLLLPTWLHGLYYKVPLTYAVQCNKHSRKRKGVQ